MKPAADDNRFTNVAVPITTATVEAVGGTGKDKGKNKDKAKDKGKDKAPDVSSKDATLAQIDTGRIIVEISRASRENGLRLPREMTMLGKTLLNLDRAVWTLDPRYDPNAAIRAEDGGFAILLDGRPVNLPGGGVLRVGPRALAEARGLRTLHDSEGAALLNGPEVWWSRLVFAAPPDSA